MKRNKMIASVVTFALLFLSAFSFSGKQAEAAQAPLNLEVKSAIMIEASTGRVLYKINENMALPPASMSKMMTELLVLEAVQKGTKKWDDIVTTDEYGHFLGKYGGSRVFLAMGERRTVKEMYEAMAIYSANDATAMLAEFLGGSEANFVKMMNQKAKQLGMTQTHFVTSTGFPVNELKQFAPPNATGDNMMSARDAAILARTIITKHPEALQVSSTPKKVFREGEKNPVMMANWNWMLPGLVYQYQGVDGLKTGHTDEAGYCFTGTAVRNGMRVITVIFGATSEAKRFGETAKLMNYGFSNFKMQTILPKDQPLKGFETVNVKKGKDLKVGAAPEKDLAFPVRIGEENKYKPVVTFNDVNAPVKKGQPIGKVTVQYSGQDVNEYITPDAGKNAGVNMVATDNVDEAGWIRLFFRAINHLVGSLFSGLAHSISGWFHKG